MLEVVELHFRHGATIILSNPTTMYQQLHIEIDSQYQKMGENFQNRIENQCVWMDLRGRASEKCTSAALSLPILLDLLL